MVSLRDAHPDLVKMSQMGRTDNGRKMWFMRIGRGKSAEGKSRKIVWVDSLINPRQWITASASLYLAHQVSVHRVQSKDELRTSRIISARHPWARIIAAERLIYPDRITRAS